MITSTFKRRHSGFRLLLCAALAMTACSRQEDPAAAAQPAPAAAAAPAAPAIQPAADVALSPENLARLVRDHSPVLGPANAKVTLVEFLDPACEACRAYSPVVKQILFLYPEDVRLVVRFADFHEGSDQAIRLLHAAREQGKFDVILAALFEGQDQWASHHQPKIEEAWQIAGKAGLNVSRARRDAASPQADALLKLEGEDVIALQVSRTPTFYVNGKTLTVFGAEPLMNLVSAEVKAAKSAP
ncbi:MAG: thioredoxin domain-containing protein [Burkholderiaceae bacterium]